MTRLRYLWTQLRQTWAKRKKNATFRIAPAIDAIIASTALPYTAHILCLGARNRIEPDCWRRVGYYNVTAIDLLPGPSVQFADMHQLQFAAHTLDLVFASHVLEHALDARRVLREIVRVLQPGGYLYVAVPTGFTPNAHDLVDFGNLRGLLDYMPLNLMPRVIWSQHRAGELRCLLRMGHPLPAGQTRTT